MLNYLVLILCLIPAVLSLLYVFLYGVNVVFWDEWLIVPVFEKFFSGSLSFSDLFAQHNEHRFFFTRLVILGLGVLTKFNNVAEMYVIQIFLVMSWGAIFWAFKRQFNLKKTATAGVWLLISFLIFSWRQHENMLFGIQITFMLTQTFALFAFGLLAALPEIKKVKTRRLSFMAAAGSGTVSSFSTLMGLFVWPLGIIPLVLTPLEKREKNFYAAAWIILGILEWWLFFSNYTSLSKHTMVQYFLSNPFDSLRYFLVAMGSSLFWSVNAALAAGMVIMLLLPLGLFLLYKRNRLRENSFWITMAGFSVMVFLAVTVGRAGLGMDQALTSRYTCFSLPAVMALLIIFLDLNMQKKHVITSGGLILVSALILSSIPFAYSEGLMMGRITRSYREKLAGILYNYESQPAELLKGFYEDPEVVKTNALILKKMGYSVFSEEPKIHYNARPSLAGLSVVSKPAAFCIDTVNGLIVIRQKQPLTITKDAGSVVIYGWAVDVKKRKKAGGVYLDLDGKLYPTYYGFQRKDVARAFRNSDYRDSGFEGTIPVADLEPGYHTLTLKILTRDRKAYYQPEKTVVLEIK